MDGADAPSWRKVGAWDSPIAKSEPAGWLRVPLGAKCGQVQSPLILASASPRRLDLLRQAGISPGAVEPTEIDERALRGEDARRTTARLAMLKAEAAGAHHARAFILGADTLVAVGGRMLGKPTEVEAARAMLARLSGRSHRVTTAIAVIAPDGRRGARVAEARVRMKVFDATDFHALLENDEWRGAAGGYRIQGRAGACVTAITGSYTAIVGLPLYETLTLLAGLGFRR